MNTPYSSHDKRNRVLAIVAASSGNLVEWFDFYERVRARFATGPVPGAQLHASFGFLLRTGWAIARQWRAVAPFASAPPRLVPEAELARRRALLPPPREAATALELATSAALRSCG